METCFSVYMLHQFLVYSKLEGILQGTKLHETPIDSHFPENKNMTSIGTQLNLKAVFSF